MGRTGRAVRLGMAAAALALAGCKDLGVRGAANVPMAIARTKPPQFWVYQNMNLARRFPYQGRTGDQFSLGGQSFIVQYPDFSGPRTALRPVGNVGGAVAYALAWERPPYQELYLMPSLDRLQVAPEIWK